MFNIFTIISYQCELTCCKKIKNHMSETCFNILIDEIGKCQMNDVNNVFFLTYIGKTLPTLRLF